jgi:mannose-6-phosphate isomerase
MALYPLKFKPRPVEKMWGGRKLATELAKPHLPGGPVGESWEIYDFPPGVVEKSKGWLSAEVAEGPLAGRTLHELTTDFRHDLCGDVPLLAPHGQFPLLIKFLDAREDLSIQVHPDSKYAASFADVFLKSEAWYIVQADPGSRLYKGLKPGTTREQFRHAIEAGDCDRLLNTVEVRPGDCFYLPSGTVHALGAGILAAEVQTPSDTTFRVHDFNRVDPKTGKKRDLHVEQAMACIQFSEASSATPAPAPAAPRFGIRRALASCEFFEMEEVLVPEGISQSLPLGRPAIWIMLHGHAKIGPTTLTRGQTVLLPAAMTDPLLTTATQCRWLEVRFPQEGRS